MRARPTLLERLLRNRPVTKVSFRARSPPSLFLLPSSRLELIIVLPLCLVSTVLRAAAHIREGNRITISFVGTPLPYLERRQVLSSIFSFDCTCPLCQLPPEERAVSDQRIQQVVDLLESVDELRSQSMSPRGSHGLLQLLTQALIIASEDAVIPTTIFTRILFLGLQICCFLGDEVHAAEWRALVKGWTKANGRQLDDSRLPGVSDLGFTLMGPVRTSINHYPFVRLLTQFISYLLLNSPLPSPSTSRPLSLLLPTSTRPSLNSTFQMPWRSLSY